jgi:hypothetical protein
VYPYTDESLVGQAVTLFASGGLRNGEGVILVMTRAHYDSTKLRLVIEGYDVDSLERSGQLACVSAEDLLAQFLVEGVPDEDIFKSILSRMIADSRATTGKGTDGRVRLLAKW